MKYILLLVAVAGASLAAQSDSDRAWDILHKGLADKSFRVRVRAVTALGAIAHNTQAQGEAENMLGDSNPKVRSAAALALGNMGAKSSADKIAALFDDPQPQEVFAAAAALRQLDDPRAYRVFYATLTGEKKTGEGLIASQLKILHDPKGLFMMGFQQGIGILPYAGSVVTAYQMMTADDVSPIRGEAALRLARDPDPRTTKALTDALAAKKWVVRAAAAEAIGQRNDPALMNNLPALFADNEDIVRYASAAAYLRLASPDSQQIIPSREFQRPKDLWTRDDEVFHRLSRLLHSF
jgi:HEAT repeat protein